MKYIALGLLLANIASAEVSYGNENSHGLKKLKIQTDLLIECKMAIEEVKDKLRKVEKEFVTNPCLPVPGKAKFESAVLILN